LTSVAEFVGLSAHLLQIRPRGPFVQSIATTTTIDTSAAKERICAFIAASLRRRIGTIMTDETIARTSKTGDTVAGTSDSMVDPWPCHRKPKKEWCDRHGGGGFMGHTCVPPLPEPLPMLYLDWFLDQYDVGLPDMSAISQSIAHLEGMLAADPERFMYLRSVATQLRSFEVMVRTLRKYQVRMPHG
jgi:hypothetical protein